eukprot:m.98276 g.98276  ORF g.98276 m.98276 type:complete len:133 (+) comp12515_c0_seq2:1528-1926(+)
MGKRTYFMAANNERECALWMGDLRRIIEKLQRGTEQVSRLLNDRMDPSSPSRSVSGDSIQSFMSSTLPLYDEDGQRLHQKRINDDETDNSGEVFVLSQTNVRSVDDFIADDIVDNSGEETAIQRHEKEEHEK